MCFYLRRVLCKASKDNDEEEEEEQEKEGGTQGKSIARGRRRARPCDARRASELDYRWKPYIERTHSI